MLDCYRILAGRRYDEHCLIMTVIDGPDFGAKALLRDGELIWHSPESTFFADHLDEARLVSSNGPAAVGGQTVFCEVPGSEKKFIVCGGGHVSSALVRMIRMLGCPVTVLEDRPQFADNIRRAGATEVICAPFSEGLKRISGDADTFFVIVTRGHQYDTECLNAISRMPHAYIGMIGSKRRVAMVKQNLIDACGCDPEVINSVYSPIGLKIGAETPEEIAVSIMAEVIQVRSQSGRRTAISRELLAAVTAEDGLRKAIATIVARKGSAPRGIGTKMLIYSDGRLFGTIGGGCAEAEVVRTARMMMDEDQAAPCLIDVDMTGNASNEGMVCGGVITVLIEILP